MSDRESEAGGVAVVGLGRFGGQLAGALIRLGHEVLAIDRNADLVQRWSDQLDRVVQADATDEDALRQVGISDFQRVVVAIGASVEASVLTVLAMVELGVSQVWARATSEKHAKILAAVGAHHVIFPEAETGERVAHLIVTRMLDFIEFGDDFAIAKVRVPEALAGKSLAQIRPIDDYGIRILGAKLPGEPFEYASDSTVLRPEGVLVVEGNLDQLQHFAELT